MKEGSMLSVSITMGAMATTRGSTAAVVQVVQPRLEAPETTKVFTVKGVGSLARKSVTASMARTAAFVIGRRAGQKSSPVRRKRSHVYAIRESSVRLIDSPAN